MLIVQEDCLEVVGEGEAHVFLKTRDDSTIIWHVLGRGGRASLKRDRPDEVTLVREASQH